MKITDFYGIAKQSRHQNLRGHNLREKEKSLKSTDIFLFIYLEVFIISFFLFFLCFCLFRATPTVYESSQVMGQIELQLPAYTVATAMQDPNCV